MIIRPNGSTDLYVAQDDHARQCGEFAAAWSAPAPKGLQIAAGFHDNGWIDWDNNPRINPTTGTIYPFVGIPVDQHMALYRRGIKNAAEKDTLTGMMVSMHGCGLYNGRYGVLPGNTPKQFAPEDQPKVKEFLTEQKALQDELRAKLAEPVTDDQLESWYALLQVWDVLSLYVLTQALRRVTFGPVRDHPALTLTPRDQETVEVSPWPFTTGEITTAVPARRMERQPFGSDMELRTAYHAAPVEEIVVRFVAA